MSDPIGRLDHIAFAVHSIDKARPFFESALGAKFRYVKDGRGGGFRYAVFDLHELTLELIEPVGNDNFVALFLEKRGEGVHHICFEVDDIDAALARLKEHGAQLIDEAPRTNAKGMRYAFIHPKSAHGVLIELYQK
jgi:methylmalonyl-CoA epimerase